MSSYDSASEEDTDDFVGMENRTLIDGLEYLIQGGHYDAALILINQNISIVSKKILYDTVSSYLFSMNIYEDNKYIPFTFRSETVESFIDRYVKMIKWLLDNKYYTNEILIKTITCLFNSNTDFKNTFQIVNLIMAYDSDIATNNSKLINHVIEHLCDHRWLKILLDHGAYFDSSIDYYNMLANGLRCYVCYDNMREIINILQDFQQLTNQHVQKILIGLILRQIPSNVKKFLEYLSDQKINFPINLDIVLAMICFPYPDTNTTQIITHLEQITDNRLIDLLKYFFETKHFKNSTAFYINLKLQTIRNYQSYTEINLKDDKNVTKICHKFNIMPTDM